MGACGSKKAAEAAEQDAAHAAPAGVNATPGRRVSYCARETTAGAVALPFPKDKIGLNSNHGIKPSASFSGVTAKINQDRGLVSYPFCNDPRQILLAVYDGHGPHGEKISEFASFTYVELLEAEASALETDTEGCMLRNMVKCDELIRKNRKMPSHDSGTTAIVARLHGSDSITTACVGDSRCVKGSRAKGEAKDSKAAWEAHDLSVDQKPDDPGERARIEAQGGYVSRASDAYGPARVWKGGFGIGPGLAMSRSLGDHAVAEVGVTAEPVMLTEAITPEDEVLILASDGVWEFISSQEAVAICQTKHPNATAATKELIKQATARWKAAEGNYRDDISAIVVSTPDQPPYSLYPYSTLRSTVRSCLSAPSYPCLPCGHTRSPGVPAHLRRSGGIAQGPAGWGHSRDAHLRAGCGRDRRVSQRPRRLGQRAGRDRAEISRDRRDRTRAAAWLGRACGLHEAAPLDGVGDDDGGARGLVPPPLPHSHCHLYCILCFYKFYCHLTVSKE